MTTMDSVTLIGIGDVHFERDDGESMFRHVQPFFDAADVVFANSEQVWGTGHAAARAHATYPHPRGADVLAKVGIDVVSFANNHAMDWGAGGLLATLQLAADAGVRAVGAGATLAQARRPVVVERNGARIGFLAYACTGPASYAAEGDRAGYAPVHATTRYEQVDSQPGTPPRIHTTPVAEHVAAMAQDIRDLRRRVDAVVVSFHWGLHFVPAVIPDYCFAVGRAAAAAGATLVLGTHAHMLKGVEIHDGVPIFYGTGNFAFEMGLLPEHRHGLDEVLAWLTSHYRFALDPAYPTFPQHPDGRYTMMVEARFGQGGLRDLAIVPCLVNTRSEPVPVRRGTPEADEVVAYLRWVTREERLNAAFDWIDDARLAVRADPGVPSRPTPADAAATEPTAAASAPATSMSC